jgi:hypothetical protein
MPITRTNLTTSAVKEQQELKQLLQENLKLTKEIHQKTAKIKSWVTMQRVWGVVKVLIILVPLILGAIYLPPLVQTVIEPAQTLYQQSIKIIQGVDQQQEALEDVNHQLKNLETPQ